MRQGLEHRTVQTLQMLSCGDGNVLQTQVGTSSTGYVAELATKLFPPLEVSSEPCLSSSGSLNGLVTVVVNRLQGDRARRHGSTLPPLLPLLQKTEHNTANRNTREGPGSPGHCMEDSPSTDEAGSRAGAEWAPLRQRSGLFNSHSSRIWLNAVTIGIYSIMLLEQ